jgi:excisionase family DNA binding protein
MDTDLTRLPAYDPVMSTKQAAAYLSISEDELKRRARRGDVSSIRAPGVRSRLKFRLSALNLWLKEHEQ